ncbi:putative iojap protein (chromatophore) [Paulinella micropora]|uniref:Iojap protein n=2 Tax=Paulinella micropora TaxID=1928728 RepID=A0A5K7W4D6_9EUKA|nr:putative iojap protein [Paulinella micropora]HRD41567.1 ribosome silencing factor [Prochlorococcaceae cyanobacterium AMR_MDS_5431]
MNSETLADLAAEACDDRKAVDIHLIEVEEVTSIADWLVITTGFSSVQVRAIARSVEEKIEKEMGRLPIHKEGYSSGSWILLDYGEVIVHILTPEERNYYSLEAFWGHGKQKTFVRSNKN